MEEKIKLGKNTYTNYTNPNVIYFKEKKNYENWIGNNYFFMKGRIYAG